ncbi:NAD-dependent epimerase/dehydratase family protein [Streptomyces werraensis]|nr:NAD-dependent epimerase/dehydratase family protein [Streptomyces werraensis]
MTAPPHPDNSPARDNTPGTVLVVGGTGFIGRAVLTALTRHHSPHSGTPTLLAVCRTPPRTGLPGVRYTAGDLTDPATLRGICSTTVVHAASYVGPDPRQCHRINHTGTRALLDEAQRQRQEPPLHGHHRGLRPRPPPRPPRGPAHPCTHLPPPAPHASSPSRTPAQSAPPSCAHHSSTEPETAGSSPPSPTSCAASPPGPTSPHPAPPSSRSKTSPASPPTALIHHPHTPSHPSTTYHAADPQPLPWDDLLARLRTLLRLPQAPPIPLCEHRSLVRRSLPRLTDHQYALLTQDHWYTTQNIWHTTRLPSGPGFHHRLTTSTSTSTSWYTQHLAQTPH